MIEQRYRAVLEVAAGVPVTEVAERFGVSRQSVHAWLRRWIMARAGLPPRMACPVENPVTGILAGSLLVNVWYGPPRAASTPVPAAMIKEEPVGRMTLGIDVACRAAH